MARKDMRLVDVMAMSKRARERTVEFLDREELDYTVSDHTADSAESNESARISFPVPAHHVESFRTALEDLGVEDDIYTVVTKPEAIVSSRFDHVEKQYETVGTFGHRRVARGELHSKAADLIPDDIVFAIMTAISAIVATAGVLLDSVSVMVGSMVIAPLLGPSMATSVATVIGDEDLFLTSARMQATGGAISVVSAVAFALFVRYATGGTSAIDVSASLQLSTHSSPTLLLVAVALCAGIAGAVSLSTSGLTSLVGVMIAAAVIPPIGVMGVGIAWLHPTVVLGSAAVVLVNVLAINLGAIVTLWYFGYHPADWSDLRRTRSVMLRRILALIALIGALVLFLTNVSTIHL